MKNAHAPTAEITNDEDMETIPEELEEDSDESVDPKVEANNVQIVLDREARHRQQVAEYMRRRSDMGPVGRLAYTIEQSSKKLEAVKAAINEAWSFPIAELPAEVQAAIQAEYTDAPPDNAFKATIEGLDIAVASLTTMHATLVAIKETGWKHTRTAKDGVSSNGSVVVGSVVNVAERSRKALSSLLNPADMDGLRVTAVAGGKVKVVGASGETVLLSRNQVVPA